VLSIAESPYIKESAETAIRNPFLSSAWIMVKKGITVNFLLRGRFIQENLRKRRSVILFLTIIHADEVIRVAFAT
jgi:hypothetical protein